MEFGDLEQPTRIDIYRVRARLARALAKVEAAMELTNEHVAHREAGVLALERLREDLLIVLWLMEIAISDR